MKSQAVLELEAKLQKAQIVGQARENQLKAHLELTNDKVAALEKEDREARITAAFNSMVRDVSRSDTDDILQRDISAIFRGDFRPWCADMCAESGQSSPNKYRNQNQRNACVAFAY